MTETIGLLPEHKSRLLKLMAEHMPDARVIVYGSRINGRSHEGSDIEIALRTTDLEPIDTERLAQEQSSLRTYLLLWICVTGQVACQFPNRNFKTIRFLD
jgi:predicted nucleotidyltransferase